MASQKIEAAIKGSIANPAAAQEIINMIDSELSSASQATVIAALGATSALSALAVTATDIPASNFTAAIPAEPTKAEIDVGIDAVVLNIESALNLKADNADVETLRTQSEARLDAIEAKIDAVIAALKTAGLMASA
jgi:hypothetical protein